jgi:predicted DNA-binding protein (MmcQ/YjbR family)
MGDGGFVTEACDTHGDLLDSGIGETNGLALQPGAKPRSTDMTKTMSPAELRDHCLSFAGAEETFPFGPKTSVFKVGGKMFALSQLGTDSLRVSLKCEPELAEALRESHAAVIPGYHLNKRHWNTVIIDGSLSEQMIKDMIEDSYELVVSSLPRASRRALDWQGYV